MFRLRLCILLHLYMYWEKRGGVLSKQNTIMQIFIFGRYRSAGMLCLGQSRPVIAKLYWPLAGILQASCVISETYVILMALFTFLSMSVHTSTGFVFSVKCQMINYFDSLFFYQLDAPILYFNTFITFLHMFRALLCSSSRRTIVLTEHLVSSLS